MTDSEILRVLAEQLDIFSIIDDESSADLRRIADHLEYPKERVLFKTHVGAKPAANISFDEILPIVIVSRQCPAVARGYQCWCIGACQKPVPDDEAIKALTAALEKLSD